MMMINGNSESESERDESDGGEGIPAPLVGIPLIPFDLFVSFKNKKKKKMVLSDMRGNIVYYSTPLYNNINNNIPAAAAAAGAVLYDSSSNPLFSILPLPLGTWKAFKSESESESEQQQLSFSVERTLNTFNKLDFNILLMTAGGDNLSLSMRGCHFWRSCTIYHHNSILAQTNLMYKLGFRKLFVSRTKFRLTLFPGFPHHHFIAALLFIFLDGRR